MSVTTTTRLGITRWSSDSDPFTRSQLDTSAASLESRVAGYLQDLKVNRPAASAAYARFLFLATDENTPNGTVYYCDGSTWYALNAFATAGAATPGDSASAGTEKTLARSDHKHSLPAYGVTGEMVEVTTTASAGASVKFARVDHAHTIANAAVTAGKIAVGGVSAGNQIAGGIIDSTHLGAGSVGAAAIAVDQRFLPGMVFPYAGITAPTGWAFCDGTSYATATQAALFAVIDYRYGGSGANFNVPDFRERVLRGAATPTSGASLGLSGGADTVTLITDNVPVHNHGVSAVGVATHTGHLHAVSITSASTSTQHTHTGSSLVVSSGGSHNHQLASGFGVVVQIISLGPSGTYIEAEAVADGNDLNWTTTTNSDSGGTHDHTISGSTGNMSASATHTHAVTGSTGSDGAHTHVLSGNTDSTGSGTAINVMPKYLTCNYIIKL